MAPSVKDAEANTGLIASESKVRRNFGTKQVLVLIGTVVLIVSAVFGIAILASVCERSWNDDNSTVYVEAVITHQSAETMTLVARDAPQCDEDDQAHMFIAHESPVTVLDGVPVPAITMLTPTPYSDYEVPIPISTQTSLSTLYSISKAATKSPSTTTPDEGSMTLPFETDCTPSTITETQIALITVTVMPLPSSDGFTTVTGLPSTVTDDVTSTSYTGLPDVTISGNPSTVTDFQTDISYTSGLPDATVSGNPLTVTDVQTSISVTQVSVVTVSGVVSTVTSVATSYSIKPSRVIITISDLWGTMEPTSRTTATATSTDAVTHYSIPTLSSSSSSSSSSEVLYTSDAKGEGNSRTRSSTISATLIIDPPYPTNGTSNGRPSGTVTVVPVPTTPIVVSGAVKLSGSMIAIAAIMMFL